MFTNLFSTINTNSTGTVRSLPGMLIDEGLNKVEQTLNNFGGSLNDGETVQVQVDAIAKETAAAFFNPLSSLLQQMDGMADAAFVSRGKNTLNPVASDVCCCMLFILFVVSSR